ncbi:MULTISPECIES: 4-vinyl reductase [Halomonas]|uniref:Hydrocarbon binding protein n=1 Tax=Halomonas casei TaxID=2742613 RepID=A0ABR9F1L9_9GAMM|nr:MULTISPECIES: 4-vinyl reductase [Halomonas]MBE0400239.1 hydrocarbon binding protein [Halomonas casei]PCC21078.1 hydrocarbon binding protein [Halomonas sp. JB37]
MTKTAPELPIEVDSETGIWTSDALPMLYVPRHFFINNHVAVEEALGAEKYAEILYQAGYKSAWHWCEKEAELHGLEDVDVFEHYMKRLSQRGWGIFITEEIDLDAGTARVRLEHSAFVYQMGKVNRKIEYMFTGWFAGAMDQILSARDSTLRTVAEQTQSGAEEGHDNGLFVVTPVN